MRLGEVSVCATCGGAIVWVGGRWLHDQSPVPYHIAARKAPEPPRLPSEELADNGHGWYEPAGIY
jgi:hypothetical protein